MGKCRGWNMHSDRWFAHDRDSKKMEKGKQSSSTDCDDETGDNDVQTDDDAVADSADGDAIPVTADADADDDKVADPAEQRIVLKQEHRYRV